MKKACLLILCLSFLLGACTVPLAPSQDVFYYPTARSDTMTEVLVPEPRELPADAELTALLELYCAGPLSQDLENAVPDGIAVRSWKLTDGELHLDFDEGLSHLSDIELTLAAACLASTFLDRCGAHTLVLTAQGALLGGESSLRLKPEDLNLRDNSPDRVNQDFTVYYTSMDRRYLIGQEVSVQVSSQEEVPMQLLELMLAPPEGSGLRCALPIGTRIRGITVEDGLCTVDMSPEFDSRRFSSISAQCLSLLSVVNTLTALPQIQRVEFTVEGDLLIRYGSLTIGAPLHQDLRSLGPVRTGLGERDCVIYLIHGSDQLLVPVPARLRQSASQSLPELVVQRLIEDPGTNGIGSHIPPGTSIHSVNVTDGTCYVDLSREYLTGNAHLHSTGRAIAASLCRLDGIDRVQILVDGMIPEGYDKSLFGILTPNDDWFL